MDDTNFEAFLMNPATLSQESHMSKKKAPTQKFHSEVLASETQFILTPIRKVSIFLFISGQHN